MGGKSLTCDRTSGTPMRRRIASPPVAIDRPRRHPKQASGALPSTKAEAVVGGDHDGGDAGGRTKTEIDATTPAAQPR